MVLNLYDHTVRKALCLSLNEYAVACEIWALSNNETYGGWCIKSKENISNTLDLSRPTIQKIINTLEEKTIIKRRENGWVRTVDEFNSIMSTRDVNLLIDGDFSVLSICKESLQSSVKKVNTDCKESLQLGVKKVNTSITISNNNSNTFIEIMEKWNSYKLKARVRNTNIKIGDNIFKKCLKETHDLKEAYNFLSRRYSKEDFESAFDAYAFDRVNRDAESDFANHSFSLYEFLKQKNGFAKFINQ